MPNNQTTGSPPYAAAIVANKAKTITTSKESDVYDRQIRLWGAEAQKKMQNSKVLYLNVTGSSSEVLKNLCLAGISATICDVRPVSVLYEYSPCFFTPPPSSPRLHDNNEQEEPSKKKVKYDDYNDNDDEQQNSSSSSTTTTVADAVKPLVEELNPLLGSCNILAKEISSLTHEDLQDFTIIVASKVPIEDIVRISTMLKIPSNNNDNGDSSSSSCVLYTIDCFGMRGVSMIDFGTPHYKYRPEVGKQLLDFTQIKDYIPLKEMVQIPLYKCTNRFHKKVPPQTWVMYRALMEYQRKTKRWLGEDDDGAEDGYEQKQQEQQQEQSNNNAMLMKKKKIIIQEFLNEQKVSIGSSSEKDDFDDFIKSGMSQISPVCAVLGGIVGNEIIKIISGKGEPANNTLLLNGSSCKAWTFLVKE